MIFSKRENQKQWFAKSAWQNPVSSRIEKSKNKLHSVLFISKSGGSFCWKQRFHRQETQVLNSRNGASWRWFVFFYPPKKYIALIINIFHVMTKINVFHHLTATRRQISAARMLRTGVLLILFAYRKGMIYHVLPSRLTQNSKFAIWIANLEI